MKAECNMLLKDFLRKTGPAGRNAEEKTAYTRSGTQSACEERQPVTVVLGSEAADLDSIVSSLLYAYFLSVTKPETNPAALVQIPRADFRLRTEAVYLFQKAGLDQGLLNFAGDLDLDRLAAEGRLRLVLTDHNKLSGTLGHLSENIVGIIDHHTDEHQYPVSASADIRPVGSTCTLAAEKILEKARGALDRQAGVLLLGTILLDTVNLDPDAGRTADADREIAEQLIRITGEDREALFEALQSEKCSFAQLSSCDLLRKDYKEWQLGPFRWGISSVMLSAEDWAARDPDLKEIFSQFQQEKKLDVLISMHACSGPVFTRQLGVSVKGLKLKQELEDFLESSELQLQRIEQTSDPHDERVVFYKQKRTDMTRKKLQPLIALFFQQYLS